MIDVIAGRWIGTPWMAGQRLRGVAVDCVQFVAAVLDEALQVPQPTPVPRLAQDTALHGISLSSAARAYQMVCRVHDLESLRLEPDGSLLVEAGDILVCQVGAGGGPGHVMLVAGRRDTAYHADRHCGVVETRWPTPSTGQRVLHAWRSSRKAEWSV